jgi:hypothetical protein
MYFKLLITMNYYLSIVEKAFEGFHGDDVAGRNGKRALDFTYTTMKKNSEEYITYIVYF